MTSLCIQKAATLILTVAVSLAGTTVWGQSADTSIQDRAKAYPLAAKVNPLIGTGGHGHTYPGACVPFGMVQLSPDTGTDGWDWCSGYHYSDRSIMGFSHTHLDGTGCADLGDFLFMPTTGELQFEPGSKRNPDEGYRSRFSHDQEQACAGFYGVYLKDYDIHVQLTTTRRVGVHQYTFPATKEANVIMDLGHYIGGSNIRESKAEIVGDQEVRGYVRKSGWSPDRFLYFVARFSQPFVKSGIVVNRKLDESAKQAEGRDIQCYVRFDTTQERVVVVKVALSAVSWDGAAKNMDAECPGWDFQQVCNGAMESWNKQLSKITVDGGPAANQTVFYTALYHSCLAPNLFTDVDGQYRGMDKKVHKADNFENYTVFSLWDTFRAAHPLFTLIEQKRTNDFVNSLLGKYEQRGILPFWELASDETWCMIGYHSIPVIADAYGKGLCGYDVNKAFTAMKHSAMQDHQGLDEYKKLGYISLTDDSQSVSRTAEYAFDDWCIALMAKELGHQDDYELFTRRSQQYRNLFDRSIGFIRGKTVDGAWKPDFNPDQLPAEGAGEFTEGNSWHYTWFAPHDVEGLIELMHGDEGFIKKMDELFVRQGREHVDVSGLIGQYAHGNEPCHNYAYLYVYAGVPWKTQEKVSQIVKTLYTDKPDGLCGNNDCGQMSAWYVFSAMGFYPVCPGQPMYVFGTPLFPSVTMNLENGKTFTVTADNVSDKNIYIQSAALNGKPYTKTYIQHADITNGGTLVFKMGDKPNQQWGSGKADRPFSIPGKRLTLMPYPVSSQQVFLDTITVEFKCDDDGAKMMYTLDGSEPQASSSPYTKPIEVNKTTTIKVRAFKDGCFPSSVLGTTVTKKNLNPAVEVAGLENGLNYVLYVGNFRRTTDFARSEPKERGQCDGFDISVAKRGDGFGLEFTGYYKAPEDGFYQFWTQSDDGSRLFIDSELVVDSDGPHSAQFAGGFVALKKGYHPIKVLYFEGSVDEVLEVHVTRPGGQREKIDSKALFCKK
ncbi:MAG: GH92 family glycosyl hydrolase [Sedimentisphaerales bacterium]|nr:GH92 family glycosyl hydrolase [Sedimentisphaerales bacterium]